MLKSFYFPIFRFFCFVLSHVTDCVMPKGCILDENQKFIQSKAAAVTMIRTLENGKTEKIHFCCFNPNKHESIIDSIISAYHEIRHLQQLKKFGEKKAMEWQEFEQSENDPFKLCYRYSAPELDARRYSNSFGLKSDWIIYEKMNPLLHPGSKILDILQAGIRLEKELHIPQK